MGKEELSDQNKERMLTLNSYFSCISVLCEHIMFDNVAEIDKIKIDFEEKLSQKEETIQRITKDSNVKDKEIEELQEEINNYQKKEKDYIDKIEYLERTMELRDRDIERLQNEKDDVKEIKKILEYFQQMNSKNDITKITSQEVSILNA